MSDEAKEKLTELGLKPVIIGNGSKIIGQIPAENEPLLSGEKVIIQNRW